MASSKSSVAEFLAETLTRLTLPVDLLVGGRFDAPSGLAQAVYRASGSVIEAIQQLNSALPKNDQVDDTKVVSLDAEDSVPDLSSLIKHLVGQSARLRVLSAKAKEALKRSEGNLTKAHSEKSRLEEVANEKTQRAVELEERLSRRSNELSTQLQVKATEVARATEELKAMRNSTQRNDKALKDIKAQYEAVTARVKSQQDELAAALRKASASEGAAKEFERHKDALDKQKAELAGQVKHLTSENTELKAKLKHASEKSAHHEKSFKQQHAELEELRSLKHKYHAQIDEFQRLQRELDEKAKASTAQAHDQKTSKAFKEKTAKLESQLAKANQINSQLKQTIAEMTQQSENTSSQSSGLVAQFEAKLAEASNQLAELEANKQQLLNQVAQLVGANSAAKERTDQLESDFAAAEDKGARLEQDLTTANERLAEEKARGAQTSQQIQTLEVSLAEARAKVSEVLDNLNAETEGKLAQLQSQIASKQEEGTQRESEANAKVEKLLINVQELTVLLDELKGQLKSEQDIVKEGEAKANRLEADLAKALNELNSLKSANEAGQSESDQNAQQSLKLIKELGERDEIVRDLKQALEAKGKAIEDLKAEALVNSEVFDRQLGEAGQATLAQQERSEQQHANVISDLEAKIQALNNELQEAKQAKVAEGGQVSVLQTQLDTALKTIKELEESHSSSSSLLAKTKAKAKERKAANLSHEGLLGGLKNQISEKEAEFAELTQKLSGFVEKHSEGERELAQAKNELEGYKAKVKDLDEANEDLHKQLDELRHGQISSSREADIETTSKIRALEDEISELKDKLAEAPSAQVLADLQSTNEKIAKELAELQNQSLGRSSSESSRIKELEEELNELKVKLEDALEYQKEFERDLNRQKKQTQLFKDKAAEMEAANEVLHQQLDEANKSLKQATESSQAD